MLSYNNSSSKRNITRAEPANLQCIRTRFTQDAPRLLAVWPVRNRAEARPLSCTRVVSSAVTHISDSWAPNALSVSHFARSRTHARTIWETCTPPLRPTTTASPLPSPASRASTVHPPHPLTDGFGGREGRRGALPSPRPPPPPPPPGTHSARPGLHLTSRHFTRVVHCVRASLDGFHLRWCEVIFDSTVL